MKNNIIKLIVSSFILILYSSILKAENVVINAQTVDIKENGNLILASGTVVITDQQNITINGDMAKYNKIDQTLEIEGNVIFVDKETIDDSNILFKPEIDEGDIIFFNSKHYHYCPTNENDKERMICSFNLKKDFKISYS